MIDRKNFLLFLFLFCFWQPAELDFQLWDGARKVTIDFKVLVSVCVECICYSPEKRRVELCINSWNSVCQPYIESYTL